MLWIEQNDDVCGAPYGTLPDHRVLTSRHGSTVDQKVLPHRPGDCSGARITVCDRLGRIGHSYWLLGTNPQSGPEFVQGPDAPAGHTASVADSWLPLPVVGVIVMTVNTRTPSRVAGSDNVTCTGKLEKVPSAQSGSQLLMLWDAVPMAFVMVQLLQ